METITDNEVDFGDIKRAFDPTQGWLTDTASGPVEPLQVLAICFAVVLFGIFALVVAGRVLPLVWRAVQIRRMVGRFETTFAGIISDPDDWEEIWTKMDSVAWLSVPALEFKEQCWVDTQGKMRNAHQSDDYFTLEVLEPKWATLGSVAPGLLTALGILGTFVGITVGLGQIHLEPNTNDPSQLTDSIENLVNSLKLSFGTSIWGLLLSILSIGLLSIGHSAFERARLRLVAFLNNRLDRGTEHDLLQEINQAMVQLVGLGEDGKGELQLIADDLAEKLEEGFGRVILGEEGPGGTREGGLASLIAESQNEGVKELVDNFVSQMNDAMGDQFQDLGNSITTMVGANQSYQDSMGSLVGQLEGATAAQAQAAEKVSEAVGEASTAITQIQETVAALSGSATEIQNAAADVGAVMTRQSGLATQQQEVADTLRERIEEQTQGWEAHQQAILETYGSMEGKFEELRDALVALTSWHDRVKNELDQQLVSWRGSVEMQVTLTESIREERSGITAMLERLNEVTATLAGLGTGLEALAKQLQQDITSIGGTQQAGADNLTEAAGQLGKMSDAMRASFAEYVDVARALTDGLPDITALLAAMGESVGVQQQVVDKQREVVTAGDLMAAQLQATAASQEAIRESFEAVAAAGEQTRQALEPAATAISGGAEALQTAVSGLEAVHEKTAGLITTLDDSANALDDAQGQASETWQEITTSVQDTSTALDEGMTKYTETVAGHIEAMVVEWQEQLTQATNLLGQAVMGLYDVVQNIEQTFDRDE